jgi:hypothetical protein
MKHFLATAACLLASAANAQELALFEFTHPTHDETFYALTDDPSIIAMARAELAKPLDDRTLHINGVIDKGDAGVNAPWSWHFKTGEWTLSAFSIELCDGWPGYVEEDVDRWLANSKSFCPWSSRLAGEKEIIGR